MFFSRKFCIATLVVCCAGGMQGAVVSRLSDANLSAEFQKLNKEELEIVHHSQLYGLAYLMSMSHDMLSALTFHQGVAITGRDLGLGISEFTINFVAEKIKEGATVSFDLSTNGKKIESKLVLDESKLEKLKNWPLVGERTIENFYKELKKQFEAKPLALQGLTQGQSVSIVDKILKTGTVKVSYLTWGNVLKAAVVGVAAGGALYGLYNKFFAAKPQPKTPEKTGWFWQKSLPKPKPQVKKGWFSFGR